MIIFNDKRDSPEWDGMPLGYTGMDELPEIDEEPEDEEIEPTEADKYDSLIDDDEEVF